ncbi:MAG: hypothetical protein O2800_05545 [Planctomycetota bacterium]|nr:hypothetical protein [Planctomycetota bacterium]
MNSSKRIILLTSLVTAASLLGGCNQKEHPREKEAREKAASKAAADQAAIEAKRSQTSEGEPAGDYQSKSTLGKARDSALRIQDKATERDKMIGDLADQVQKGGG